MGLLEISVRSLDVTRGCIIKMARIAVAVVSDPAILDSLACSSGGCGEKWCRSHLHDSL